MNPSNQRVLRMLAMVPYLRSRAGVPVAELARGFGVRPRQIVDDLRVLMLTGTGELHGELIDFDLAALEDEGVARIRDADFMPRPLRFSVREATSLIVALRALRGWATGEQTEVIDSALAKLENAVGRSLDPQVEVAVTPVDPAVKDAVLSALSRQVRLQIDYANANRDELTRRLVDPRAVYLEKGQLYLSAWCLLADDIRTFRVDRIVAAKVTDTPVESHVGDAGAADAPEPEFEVPAVLDLAPEALWMVEHYNAEVISTHGDTTRIRLSGSNISWLSRLVLGAMGAVRVVEPPELAQNVRASLAHALARYAGDQDN